MRTVHALVAALVLMVLAGAFSIACSDEDRAERKVPGGTVTTPESSVQKPGDVGVRSHSNVEIFTPNEKPPPQPPSSELYKHEDSQKP